MVELFVLAQNNKLPMAVFYHTMHGKKLQIKAWIEVSHTWCGMPMQRIETIDKPANRVKDKETVKRGDDANG